MKTKRTFREWSDDGYKIIKGSKSIGRNENGECLFSDEQVIRFPKKQGFVSTSSPLSPTSRESCDGNGIAQCCESARIKGTPYGVIEDFDSLVREASRPPVLGRSPIFSVTNPIEAYFLDVADKHGIIDRMYDEWENGDY